MLKLVFSGAVLSMAIRLSGIALMFIAHAILARTLGQGQYGIFIFAITIVIPVVAMVSMLGLQHTSLKYLPEYSASGNSSLELGYIIKSLQITAIAAIILIASGRYLSLTVSLPPIVEPVLKSALWVTLGFAATQIIQQAFRANKRIVMSQVIEQIGLPLLLIMAGITQLVGVANISYEKLFLGIGLYYLVAAVGAGLILIRSIKGGRQHLAASYRTGQWLRNSIAACLVGVITVLASRIDILVLGWYEPPEQIAIYGVASRIAGLMIVIFAATNAMAGPVMSELYSTAKYKKMISLFRSVVIVSVAASGILFLLMMLAGEYALLAFGRDYVVAWDILVILAAGQMINLAAGGPTYFLLMIMGRAKLHMYIIATTTMIMFAILMLVVPLYGALGAAITTTSVTLLSNVVLLFALNKKLSALGREAAI